MSSRGVHGVLHDHAVGDDAEALGLVEQAQVVEDAGAVRGDLHAGPDLAELALALVQLDREALLGEGGGRGEAADAAPDDEHVGALAGRELLDLGALTAGVDVHRLVGLNLFARRAGWRSSPSSPTRRSWPSTRRRLRGQGLSERGVLALGHAIHDPDGVAIASLGIAMPASRFEPPMVRPMVATLRKAAREIEGRLAEEA
ncbi:hypothetical protein J4N02_14605 [Propioniciclava sp. MC1595]|nr:IclR family transcriptional regulator C-terminal domain-containing protein [Propioniciclava sp. MC1595]QTE25708.1 hypothetical protein J4N02_14605 [Propioniciclava sp. MC1595]